MDKVNKSYQISTKVYELIYELNVICPTILLSVLPQLECKLKAGQESERLSEYWFCYGLFFVLSNIFHVFPLFIELLIIQRPWHYWLVCFPKRIQH